ETWTSTPRILQPMDNIGKVGGKEGRMAFSSSVDITGSCGNEFYGPNFGGRIRLGLGEAGKLLLQCLFNADFSIGFLSAGFLGTRKLASKWSKSRIPDRRWRRRRERPNHCRDHL
uniref:Uncharacterized protein n=1 Tax=Laticauda laticaudata TaxID=8630 RepID=A0A8C5SB76_LATLA